MISSWWHGFFSLLFPEKCPFCQKITLRSQTDSPLLCSECLEEIHWIRPPFCPQCGRPYPHDGPSHLCSDCIQNKNAFDTARAVVYYQNGIAGALRRFKYHGETNLIRVLTELWQRLEADHTPGEVIVPVPLHPRRLRERGFNQAVLLAKPLGRMLRIKVYPRVLKRVRNTLPQVDLKPEERRKNVRGAFAVREKSLVYGRKIILIDDVYTTGATVQECTKILKRSGAKEVHVLTLARVVPN
jgi:ComF family protein